MRRTYGLLWTLLLAAGCPEGGGSSGAGVTPDAADAADAGDGPIAPIGPQGCAEVFLDPETGLCDPDPDDCPPGHIPVFSEGCKDISIPGCYADFFDEETGLCDPKPEDCPPGTIPVFTEGCVPTGITDCHPDFWNEEAGFCDPDPLACGDYGVPVASEGCVSIDPPGGCGEGTWGPIEEQVGDVHVDPSYGGGDPDGTRERPWPLIGHGLSDVQAGGRLVLAGGVYEEGVLLGKSVQVVGRCASMVVLAGVRNGPGGPTAVEVKGDVDVGLRDVTVSADGIGVMVHSGARLFLERASVTDNRHAGLLLDLAGTTVTATDLVVARTRALANGTAGRGVNVQGGAALSIERGNVTDNHDMGLYVAGADTTVTAQDLVVARTLTQADGTHGRGITAREGAALSLERGNVTDNYDVGLYVAGAGTTVTATDLVVARTQPLADGTLGRGITVQDGAALDLQRASVMDNHDIGLFVDGTDTTVTAKEIIAARTLPRADGKRGRGMTVQGAARLSLERATITDNRDVGLFVSGADTTVTTTDLVVARTLTEADGTSGRGIGVQEGAALSLERASVTDNHNIGLYVSGAETTVTATDLVVARTETEADGTGGRGIEVHGGAGLIAERTSVADNRNIGIMVNGADTTVTATDLVVARTLAEADGDGGRGMEVQDGAALVLERASVTDNRAAGLFVVGADTIATATDLLVTGTQTDVNDRFGRGVHVQFGAALSLERAAITDNHEGALVFLEASGSITDAVLSGTDFSADPLGVADGLVALDSEVTATRVAARDNVRAGFLFSQSPATLQRCSGTGNYYGLVVNGDINPHISSDSAFEGNTVNQVLNASLAVQDEVTPVPALDPSAD